MQGLLPLPSGPPATPDPTLSTWRLQPWRRLHWIDWGGDSVVYDESSGDTHLFSPLVAAAMACLEERPCSAPELTAALADALGCAADGELHLAVAAALEQFRELDWIEPLTVT